MYAVRVLSSLLFIGCFDLDMGQDIVGCNTTANPCIFPFKYDGITYNACTARYTWCATEEDSDWGDCSDGCSGIVGCKTGWVKCIFPFKYKGNTYDKCTTTNPDRLPWCATKVDEEDDNQMGDWAWCLNECLRLGNSTMATTTQEATQKATQEATQEATTLLTTTLGDTTNSSTMVPTSMTIK
eukprot:GFUD01069765.1.p1 GENE.GFUD01069765.1~~GFUD01069765.1.p1  ORF type:complete len:183 (-),score=7.04 GFUD01069765.1:35-583(-)